MAVDTETKGAVSPENIIDLRGISKQFPGVLANDNIDFDVRKGEIHCLLGENGAGKTTLMKILYGMYHADEGEIWVKGEKLKMKSPLEAIHHGHPLTRLFHLGGGHADNCRFTETGLSSRVSPSSRSAAGSVGNSYPGSRPNSAKRRRG